MSVRFLTEHGKRAARPRLRAFQEVVQRLAARFGARLTVMHSGLADSARLEAWHRARVGGAGIVIDGCMRDRPNVEKLDLALWLRGWTPNYHVQTSIYPNAVNVPIACGGVTVIPGDIIVADDDGAVVVPVAMAQEVIEKSSEHHEWEEYSRIKLKAGAPLQRYYPLHDDARGEYEEWRKSNPILK